MPPFSSMSSSGIDVRNDPFLTHTSLPPAASASSVQKSGMGSSNLSKKWAANARSKMGGMSAMHHAKDTPGYMLFAGAILPAVLFVGHVALFTFREAVPKLGFFLVGLFVLFAMIFVWPLEAPALEGIPMKRARWEWFPAVICLFSVLAGTFFGRTNYSVFILPSLHYEFNREYTNVNPGLDPGGFGDAGAIYFSSTARLDTAKSVGYQDFTTFCVAPIVGDNPSDPVGFWAAGLGCCESRSEFRCGDATDPSARAGLRISETDPLGDKFPHFKKAVKMAAGVYGFKASENPILVHWVKDPKVLADSTYWMAMIFLGISGVVALLGMCVCTSCLHVIKAI